MTKKSALLGKGIGASLKAESEAVPKDRFAAADAAMADRLTPRQAPEPEPQPPKKSKPKAERTCRGGFSMPESDYVLLEQLQGRLMDHRIAATQSQILRAALRLMVELSDDQIVKRIEGVDRLRPGPK